MRINDLISSAVSNTFRSKSRTVLTILAIFVGAFTLTITNGLGTGINRYIDDTVNAIGANDVLTVTKPAEDFSIGGGPIEYDPDAISTGRGGPPGTFSTVTALTPDDFVTLETIDGVLRIEATKLISLDYVQYSDGTRYLIGAGSIIPGQTVLLAAGDQPDQGSAELQVALPDSYVEPLGFADVDAAIGETITLAITDAERTQHLLEARVVGVAEESLTGVGSTLVPNDALTNALFTTQNIGVPDEEKERYASASLWFDAASTDAQVVALKERINDAGYDSTTIADQLGTFKTVIDGIVLVLNAFAVIALLAASFGIVNTLLMSVQERTREIGLMKAMGMGSAKVFGLFSLEAMFIGFLGSVIGTVIGMLVGTWVSSALSSTVFADLAGLTLIAFDPLSIVTIIVIVMVIAFLAGTLPAIRAAKADPVESLRYE
jgi:putative ABC transport system permease protein